MAMSQARLERLRALIAEGQEHRFYLWGPWRRLRAEVLRMDRYECQLCRARGRYARAVLVHHVKHLQDRPDLALSIYDPDTGERQLVAVCADCHRREHPEALVIAPRRAETISAERWD